MTNDQRPQPEPTSPLASSIMERLDQQCVVPTSSWVFVCHSCLMRLLFVLSILVGALAVAVSLFSLLHTRYALYEATHENVYTFLVDNLPYAWLLVLALITLLATLQFRRTGRGYRYSLTIILGSSIGLSILGGIGLHAAGVGAFLDSKLGSMAPGLYVSQEGKELYLWMRPDEGRLVGHVSAAATGTTVAFVDVEGTVWHMVTFDLQPPDRELLFTGDKVRVLGIKDASSTMHACGVFPWLFDPGVTMAEMAAERRAFVERMYAHKDYAEKRAAELEAAVLDRNDMGRCATLPVVRRVSEAM